MSRTRSQSASKPSEKSPPEKKRLIVALSKTRSASSNRIIEERETITKTTKIIKKTTNISTILKKQVKKKKKVELVITTNALRPRKGMNFIWRQNNEDEDDGFEELDSPAFVKRKRKKKIKTEFLEEKAYTRKYNIDDEDEDIYEEETKENKIHVEALDKIPKNKKQLKILYDKVTDKIKFYREQFIKEQEELAKKSSNVTSNSIPISVDVRNFDFKRLQEAQKQFGGRLFDVIMMDPPWQLSTSQPSRGVAIAYESLSDEIIEKLPINKLQDSGFIFIWTINAKYSKAIKLMEHWGYTLVDEVTWIKKTVNGKIAKGHGFYLQHAKESCLVGVKGKLSNKIQRNIGSDVIFSARRGQSQKPEEIYDLIEQLVPNGFYLELFGRRNNLRDRWVTIGNEL